MIVLNCDSTLFSYISGSVKSNKSITSGAISLSFASLLELQCLAGGLHLFETATCQLSVSSINKINAQ